MPGVAIGYPRAPRFADARGRTGRRSLRRHRAGRAASSFALGEAYLLVRQQEGVGMGDVFLVGDGRRVPGMAGGAVHAVRRLDLAASVGGIVRGLSGSASP